MHVFRAQCDRREPEKREHVDVDWNDIARALQHDIRWNDDGGSASDDLRSVLSRRLRRGLMEESRLEQALVARFNLSKGKPKCDAESLERK